MRPDGIELPDGCFLVVDPSVNRDGWTPRTSTPEICAQVARAAKVTPKDRELLGCVSWPKFAAEYDRAFVDAVSLFVYWHAGDPDLSEREVVEAWSHCNDWAEFALEFLGECHASGVTVPCGEPRKLDLSEGRS